MPACRDCNSTFGCTFEARASKLLVRPYVQLALWGVPLPETAQSWQSALEIDGAVIDLSVDSGGIRARSDRPIVIRDDQGNIDEIYFSRDAQLQKFVAGKKRKRPDERWLPVEKRVATNSAGLRMQMEFGPDLYQLALKMSLAGASLVPSVNVDDVLEAGKCLHQTIGDVHPRVAQYFRRIPGIDSVRPSLAHTLYVEHVGRRLVGLVQYFGVYQAFSNLSMNTHDEGHGAIFGWIDPVTLKESWADVEPLWLPEPPPGYWASEIIGAQLQWTALLHASAVQRGARDKLDVIVTAHLPRQT